MKQENTHKLQNSWTIWVHDLYDTNWDINSYKKIYEFNTIEDFWVFFNNKDAISSFDNYMYFLMKTNIPPIWENKCNINGGAYSYIISKNSAKQAWIKLCIKLIGETLTHDDILHGTSYSPKPNISIIKIWNKNSSIQCNLNINVDVKIRYKAFKEKNF